MSSFPYPSNEESRLAALRGLRILDTAAEGRFDRITRLAARLFDVPMALITLIDEHRQWFKSSYGMDAPETPRNVSFCTHAICGEGALVVPDATRDERFKDNGAVTKENGVRFYAGFPLETTDGFRIGTLCIADHRPREFTEAQISLLQDIAGLAQDELNSLTIREAKEQVERSERRWRFEHARFEAFMENSPCVCYLKDQEGAIVYHNREFGQVFSKEAKPLVGTRALDLLPVDVAARMMEVDRKVLDTHQTQELTVTTATADGSLKKWLVLKFPVQQPGSETLLGGVAVDITEQQAAESALRLSEERYRELFENAGDIIFSVSPDGRFRYVNPAWHRTFGYDEDGLSELRLWDIVHPGSRLSVARHFLQLLGGGMNSGIEAAFVDRNGAQLTLEGEVSCRVESGQLIETRGIFRNVTVRREAEDALRVAAAAAQQANETKSRFIANISHEVRTPLNGILGVTGMLRETGLDAMQKEMAETIQTSAEELLEIMNEVLDFSKVEAGHVEIESNPFNLPEMLERLLRLHLPRARAKGLTVLLERDPSVPAWVVGDALRLGQVLGNLLGNAVKFSEKGTIRLRVHPCHGNGTGPLVCFSVEDEGIGIPDEAQSRIWEAFAQADSSTTRQYGGTGLGLSISQQLVGLMGGKMKLRSEAGTGSCFSFEIPLPRSMKAVPGAPEAALPPLTWARPFRVLVGEDSAVNRMVLLHELRALQCEVNVAEDGEQVLQALTTVDGFDLILMDCHMPKRDGYDTTRAIRKMEAENARPRIPIVGITANAMAGARERCLESGMDDYMTKPYTRAQLHAMLRQYGEQPGHSPSPPAAEPEPRGIPPISPSELHALREECATWGPGAFEELVRTFGEETTTALRELRHAADEKNAAELRRVAHKLKGCTSSFGAAELLTACESLEAHARAGRMQEALPLLPIISNQIQSVRTLLDAELATSPERTFEEQIRLRV